MRVTIDGVTYNLSLSDVDNLWGELTKTSRARVLPTLTPARKSGKAPSYTAKQAATVLSTRADGHSLRAIAETVGLSLSCVQRICNKESWDVAVVRHRAQKPKSRTPRD